jgi:hypothetical protein
MRVKRGREWADAGPRQITSTEVAWFPGASGAAFGYVSGHNLITMHPTDDTKQHQKHHGKQLTEVVE